MVLCSRPEAWAYQSAGFHCRVSRRGSRHDQARNLTPTRFRWTALSRLRGDTARAMAQENVAVELSKAEREQTAV
jgi:hypothetical protein